MIEIQFTEGNCCNNKRWHIASSCGTTHEPLLLPMYSSELLILTNCQFSSHLDYSLYYLDYNKVWDACADAAVDCQWLKSQDIEECETKPDCSCIGRDFVFSCFPVFRDGHLGWSMKNVVENLKNQYADKWCLFYLQTSVSTSSLNDAMFIQA